MFPTAIRKGELRTAKARSALWDAKRAQVVKAARALLEQLRHTGPRTYDIPPDVMVRLRVAVDDERAAAIEEGDDA